MVDFSKRIGKLSQIKKIDPFEIYDSLDRRSVTGPLRPIQASILQNWHEKFREKKDLIIKLHTGSGKTLIGLLILQSRLNENSSPCLYVCPNIYLSLQVCLEARKFGIPYCVIKEDNEIPNNFIEGKKILITYSQKLFNGRTKFGLDNAYFECDSIILDDSHACIESIKSAFTIKLNNKHPLYTRILNLFEEDLLQQGPGTLLEIKDSVYNSQLHLPYWSFNEKSEEILQFISEYKNDDEIRFTWPLIKDSLQNMQMHISGYELELTPYYIPVDRFGTFAKANQRVLMSATTQDDSFFIKGLSFEKEAVKNPLEDPSHLWSGEKMILIPSLINDTLERDLIVTRLSKPSKRPFGTVAITPSYRMTEQYRLLGAEIANQDDIFDKINLLKGGAFSKTLVFANRYDGIDLPDEACRILILDSKPYFMSLSDRYEEYCRGNSDLMYIKLAQKVEQGLGRSVRGEKDYSAVVIIGDDLVKFLRSSRTNKYFSDQTQRQIEIGLEIAEMAKDDVDVTESPFKVISSLLIQAIVKRDPSWKAFYHEKMNNIKVSSRDTNIYDLLEKERIAEEWLFKNDPEKSVEIFQEIIDNNCNSEHEKAYYLQQMSRSMYSLSKSKANALQKVAFTKNKQLLKPKEGISYNKVEFIDNNRVQNIIKWIKKNGSFDDMMLSVNEIFCNLTFGMPSEKFESALEELGVALGFISERPDKEYKTGPDNLWCGVGNSYFIFECKSEVEETRIEIKKSEASQMNTHSGWFKDIYGEIPVKRILIIPTRNLSKLANFTHEVEIMRKGKLRSLKDNVISFFKELKNFRIDSLPEEKINELLSSHKLQIVNLQNDYTENYFKNS